MAFATISLDTPCGVCHKISLMSMNGFPRRSLLVGVSVTCRFDDEDAEAIAYELRGVLERLQVEQISVAS